MLARRCLFQVTIIVASCGTLAHADIYRWDHGAVIPETEGVTPSPGVMLDHHELAYAEFYAQDLTDSRFDFSNLANAHLNSAPCPMPT